ncbi:MAG: response regulator transcription factor [Planctomycetota bacterium]|jgi:DNA-binding NarL/FixJ family response regulator
MALGKNRLVTAGAWSEMADGLGMSPRQNQIARCLFRGLGDKQIAQELGVAVPTIRTHISRLFTKLDVADRVELILFLMQQYCGNYCPHRQ